MIFLVNVKSIKKAEGKYIKSLFGLNVKKIQKHTHIKEWIFSKYIMGNQTP